VRSVLQHRLPAALSTIDDPRFAETELQGPAVTALTVFNEMIIREAFQAGIPLLDLRLICDAEIDYVPPSELLVAGRAKITSAIARVVQEHEFRSGRR
jgi:hypothetical protein